MTQITLSNGKTIEVQPVPPLALNVITARHPLPVDADEAETQSAMQARERLLNEAAWLLALENVEVPDDWSFPTGLLHAGVEPRTGDHGPLLDYIEYGLLATTADVQRVQAAMYGEALTEAEVVAAEATFPADS